MRQLTINRSEFHLKVMLTAEGPIGHARCFSSSRYSEGSIMYKAEHLSCLIDAGRIKSSGWFVTQQLETIEVGLCHFDGSISGFRWNEETGWEPIFVVTYHSVHEPGVITIWTETKNNPYSEDEIAAGLKEYFARTHQDRRRR